MIVTYTDDAFQTVTPGGIVYQNTDLAALHAIIRWYNEPIVHDTNVLRITANYAHQILVTY